MIILGIETSCDETAVSVIRATGKSLAVVSNVVSSQVKLHAQWGGVVPSLAAREHLKNIVPVFNLALKKAGLSIRDVDLISVTQGPGLIPALLIGTNFAKTIAYSFQKPLIGIHHIEGHIYANFIGVNSKLKKINFPILALVVSGGHTQLILMTDHLKYQLIGETLDDAAGEAFDKVARILNLGYPGGPLISAIVEKCDKEDKKYKINFPRPLIKRPDFDFSFSGLKTAVLYETKKHPNLMKSNEYVAAVAEEFQQAVLDVLILKTIKAAKKYKPKTIVLAGGVSANRELRKQLGNAVSKELPGTAYVIPDPSYSIDNAAMIAAAGFFRFQKMNRAQKKSLLNNWTGIEADAGLRLK